MFKRYKFFVASCYGLHRVPAIEKQTKLPRLITARCKSPQVANQEIHIKADSVFGIGTAEIILLCSHQITFILTFVRLPELLKNSYLMGYLLFRIFIIEAVHLNIQFGISCERTVYSV